MKNVDFLGNFTWRKSDCSCWWIWEYEPGTICCKKCSFWYPLWTRFASKWIFFVLAYLLWRIALSWTSNNHHVFSVWLGLGLGADFWLSLSNLMFSECLLCGNLSFIGGLHTLTQNCTNSNLDPLWIRCKIFKWSFSSNILLVGNPYTMARSITNWICIKMIK